MHASTAAVAPVGRMEAPATLRLFGRPTHEDNSDICGEYHLAAEQHEGRAVYVQAGRDTAIYFDSYGRRWIVNRSGVEIVAEPLIVAYADDDCGYSTHPGRGELAWHVYDSQTNSFLEDARLVAIEAPLSLALFGRNPSTGSGIAMGYYGLVGLHHDRPAYQHKKNGLMLRFDVNQGQWLITSVAGGKGLLYHAAAADTGEMHPGHSRLEWMFSEPRGWIPDPAVKAVVAPEQVLVISKRDELAHMVGNYRLAGHWEDRPVYQSEDNSAVIRYCARSDRWLMQVGQAQASPSSGFISRTINWLFTGAWDVGAENCSAMASAAGTRHPGSAALQWRVWDARRGRFMEDNSFLVTNARQHVYLSGCSDPADKMTALCGMYTLAGSAFGRVFYVQERSGLYLRWEPDHQSWVIQLAPNAAGVGQREYLAAAKGATGCQEPFGAGPWLVFNVERGQFLKASTLRITDVMVDSALRLTDEVVDCRLQPSEPLPATAYSYGPDKLAQPRERFTPYSVGGA